MIPINYVLNSNEILFKYAMYPSSATHGIIILMVYIFDTS